MTRTSWAGPNPYGCYVRRNWKFDLLGCCLPADHEGPHNFVVLGVLPYEPGYPLNGQETARKGRVKWNKKRTENHEK